MYLKISANYYNSEAVDNAGGGGSGSGGSGGGGGGR